MLKSQAMVSDAFQLSMQSQTMIVTAQQRATSLITVFIILIIAIMAAVSFMFSRSVAKPITRLHEGTEIIGSGNLEFRVGTDAKDEIGQLSRAFDEMIGKRKQAEEEIRRLNEELERRVLDRTAQLEAANKELETFSYSVSHDLRAPLRSIDGFSHALLVDWADRLDEKGRDYLNRVRAESQRMGELIDDILKLSRVTRSEIQVELVDMGEMAQAIAEELRRKETSRSVDFEIETGLVVKGDRRLLTVMMENLLSNAWKFTGRRTGARIEFGVAEQEGKRVYFVRDNGAGFNMAYVNKLFVPFQRLHTPAEFPGTGIGLATVQRVIRRHGGRVWAEGAVEKGATFYFTLPG